jgi:hypothetical protein
MKPSKPVQIAAVLPHFSSQCSQSDLHPIKKLLLRSGTSKQPDIFLDLIDSCGVNGNFRKKFVQLLHDVE